MQLPLKIITLYSLAVYNTNESQDESVVSYILSVREKLKQKVYCMHENLTKQQDRQYDTIASVV